MGSSLPRTVCMQRDSGQEGSGGKRRQGWRGPAPPALFCWGRSCWAWSGQGHHSATEGSAPHVRTRTERSPQPGPREPGKPSEDGNAKGDGATCPLGAAGTAGSWERRELGLSWKQVLGTSRGEEGWGCGAGGSGVHIWQRRGGRKRRAGPTPPARLPRGPGGPRRCQMLCSCLRRFLSLHAPHPPGSSSLRFLGVQSGGDLPSPPLLRPRLPEPPGLCAPAFGSFPLGLTAPTLLPPLRAPSLLFFSCQLPHSS